MKCYTINLAGEKEKLFEAKLGNAELLRHLFIEDYNNKAQYLTVRKATDDNGDLLVVIEKRRS